MVYAIIDTNIIVSSFITKNPSSSTRRVINSMLSGKIKPLYNDEILDEYFDVLNRSKFHLSEIKIHELFNFFKENGIDTSRFPYDGEMPDEVLSKELFSANACDCKLINYAIQNSTIHHRMRSSE